MVRDAVAPTLTLAALMHGTDVYVTWSADDSGSGVDASTCRLEVREDEGTWQPFSTECGGDDTYEGQPGYTYAFRFSASDNVGNADSLEAEAVVPYAKKYYYANGQRVAMREGDVVYYIHADHLGSTSVLSEGDGEPMPGSRVAYLPYGGLRLGDASTLPTDYGFTGQRLEAGIGLMHYGARFYSPRLGRFVSADTIVPEAGNPQAFNRYAYAANNPHRYVDPAGQQFVQAGALVFGGELVVLGLVAAAVYCSYQYGLSPNAAQNREATAAAIEDTGVAIGDAYERGKDSLLVRTVEASGIIVRNALADALTEDGTGSDEASPAVSIPSLEIPSTGTLELPLPARRQDRGAGPWDRREGQNPNRKPFPKPEPLKGPPLSNEPGGDLEFKPTGPPKPIGLKEKILFALFGLGALYRGADATQLDQLWFHQEFPGGPPE